MLSTIKKTISRLLLDRYFYEPSTNLTNQVVVVTGASQGLGKMISEVLTAKGATVVGVSRENGGDVTQEKDVDRIVERAMRRYGKIDVLINTVGKFTGGPIENATVNEFDDIVNTNVRSVFLMSRAVVPIMKKQKAGFILNIGSKISRNTAVSANKVLYAMTKYAVEGFSFALNRELKPWGIRVSCLMPGTLNRYLSLHAHEYLSIRRLAEFIGVMIQFADIDFESVVVKSKHHSL